MVWSALGSAELRSKIMLKGSVRNGSRERGWAKLLVLFEWVCPSPSLLRLVSSSSMRGIFIKGSCEVKERSKRSRVIFPFHECHFLS